MKIEEKFPGDEHAQIYCSVREYPMAFRATLGVGWVLGLLTACIVHVILILTGAV